MILVSINFYQLHMISTKAFDANHSLEIRYIFLDMSKAFDRFWHGDILSTLKCLGRSGNYYSLINSFLSNRHQRTVPNGQSSKWFFIRSGVPQGSNSGPSFFLVYINVLPKELLSNPKLYADEPLFFQWFKIF